MPAVFFFLSLLIAMIAKSSPKNVGFVTFILLKSKLKIMN